MPSFVTASESKPKRNLLLTNFDKEASNTQYRTMSGMKQSFKSDGKIDIVPTRSPSMMEQGYPTKVVMVERSGQRSIQKINEADQPRNSDSIKFNTTGFDVEELRSRPHLKKEFIIRKNSEKRILSGSPPKEEGSKGNFEHAFKVAEESKLDIKDLKQSKFLEKMGQTAGHFSSGKKQHILGEK